MNEEELKAFEAAMAIKMQAQIDAFKANQNFTTPEQVKEMFKEVATNESLADKFKEVMDIAEKQGITLQSIGESMKNVNQTDEISKSLAPHKAYFEGISKTGVAGTPLAVEIKTINASSFTDRTANYQDTQMGEYDQGNPFIMNLIRNAINVPANNHGSVAYWYQGAPTNNAGNVAENAAATASSFAWTESSIAPKKINANIKVSIHQLYDMNFVRSQVASLLNKDFMLQLNEQLINGVGTTVYVAGLSSYATALSTVGYEDSIIDPDLVDVLNLGNNQMIQNTKNGNKASDAFCRNNIIYGLQTKKSELTGMRIYPDLAQTGKTPMISGINLTSNELSTDNYLMIADMNAAQLYNWGGITFEVIQTGDDALNQLVTFTINARLNLLVKPTDTEAIIKVANYDTVIAALKVPADA